MLPCLYIDTARESTLDEASRTQREEGKAEWGQVTKREKKRSLRYHRSRPEVVACQWAGVKPEAWCFCR